MSRCFPYWPPVCENNATVNHADLNKNKEKKRKKEKKEKKDKEKGEGKEKKDGERSKEKHREKKDRKEKHRDKKDKEKDKSCTLADKKVGHLKCSNGNKLGPTSVHNDEINEFGRRTTGEDRGTGHQLDQKISFTDKKGLVPMGREQTDHWSSELEKTNNRKDDRKVGGFRNHVDARGVENVVQRFSGSDKKPTAKKNGEEEERSENSKKISDARGLENQIVPDLSRMAGKRDEQNTTKMKNILEKQQMGGKETIVVDSRGLENGFVEDLSGLEKKGVERITKPARKKIEAKQVDVKEKNEHKQKRSNVEKHKDRDREKKNKSNGKEKEKEEKAGPSKEQPNINGITEPSHFLQSIKANSAEGFLGIRKEPETNGFLHGFQPSKLRRPISSPQKVMENDRKLEPCQTAVDIQFENHGIMNGLRVDNKEHKINRTIEAQKRKVGSMVPLSAKVDVQDNDVVPKKSPHPDSKFLDEILSIPKMEEYGDFDEQEWLFSSDNQMMKKLQTGSSAVHMPQRVWAEGLKIESADVFALPYVIPY